MDKAELEKIIDTKNLILQGVEALDEMKKMQKRADLIGWIGLILMFAVGFLVIIALPTVIFFL